MCLTFARPKRLLEEAVHSFLIQDYPGDKALLILNDFGRQVVRFDHPQVTVVNVPSRFHSLGEKRNAAVALCRHDLLAVWDDDDIYLPHRLSFSAAMYDEAKRFFKLSQAFFINNGVVSGPTGNLFHSGGMWHRSLFDEVGGYKHMGTGEDADLEERFHKVIGEGKDYEAPKPSEIFYLYRWAGTQSYHVSGFGTHESDQVVNAKVREFALHQLEEGVIHPGEILLQPGWMRIIQHWLANTSRRSKDPPYRPRMKGARRRIAIKRPARRFLPRYPIGHDVSRPPVTNCSRATSPGRHFPWRAT